MQELGAWIVNEWKEGIVGGGEDLWDPLEIGSGEAATSVLLQSWEGEWRIESEGTGR